MAEADTREAKKPFIVVERSLILTAKSLSDKILKEKSGPCLSNSRVAFVSHKWFNDKPDDVNNTFLKSLQQVLHANEDVTHVWIDYVCSFGDIREKMEFINSIPSYLDRSSVVWAFTHDMEVYRDSAWCAYELFGQKKTTGTVYLMKARKLNAFAMPPPGEVLPIDVDKSTNAKFLGEACLICCVEGLLCPLGSYLCCYGMCCSSETLVEERNTPKCCDDLGYGPPPGDYYPVWCGYVCRFWVCYACYNCCGLSSTKVVDLDEAEIQMTLRDYKAYSAEERIKIEAKIEEIALRHGLFTQSDIEEWKIVTAYKRALKGGGSKPPAQDMEREL